MTVIIRCIKEPSYTQVEWDEINELICQEPNYFPFDLNDESFDIRKLEELPLILYIEEVKQITQRVVRENELKV